MFLEVLSELVFVYRYLSRGKSAQRPAKGGGNQSTYAAVSGTVDAGPSRSWGCGGFHHRGMKPSVEARRMRSQYVAGRGSVPTCIERWGLMIDEDGKSRW